MKNLLSKTLLCGVLATSFVLINCQKAPARKVTPDASGFNKPGPIAKSGPCSAASVTAYDAAKAALDALKADAAKPNPNASELSAKLAGLKKLIDAAKASIASSTKENDADSCVKENKEDPKKPANLSVADFNEPYTKLANFIKGLGGSVPATALKAGDKLELSEAVAALFTNPANGCISGGALKTTAECTELAAKPDVTTCSFTGDTKPVAAAAKADVLTVESKEVEGRKTVTINVLIKAPAAAEGEEAEGDRAMKIDCAIANTIRADDKAAEAATAALGETVKKIVALEPVAVDPEAPKGEEKAPEAPKAASAPVSDDLANRAQEALETLGQ